MFTQFVNRFSRPIDLSSLMMVAMKKMVLFLFLCFSLLAQANPPETAAKNPEPGAALEEPAVELQNAKEGFTMGLQFFQKQKFDLAEEAFLKSIQFDPINKYSLLNLGLSALQNNRPGLAIAAWRRAIFVDPSMDEAHKSLDLTYKQIPHAKPKSRSILSGPFKTDFLDRINLDFLSTLVTVLFILTGLSLVRFFALRKKAFDRDLELPSVPTRLYGYVALFVLFVALTSLKVISVNTTLATLIEPTQAVYTSPNLDSSTMFELREGQEILLNQINNDWAFIKYPGGLSGWVPKRSIFIHSGSSLL